MHLIGRNGTEETMQELTRRRVPFYWALCGGIFGLDQLTASPDRVHCGACQALAPAPSPRLLSSSVSLAAPQPEPMEIDVSEFDDLQIDMDESAPTASLLPGTSKLGYPPADVLIESFLKSPGTEPVGAFGTPDVRSAITDEERSAMSELLALIVNFGMGDKALPILRTLFRLSASASGHTVEEADGGASGTAQAKPDPKDDGSGEEAT